MHIVLLLIGLTNDLLIQTSPLFIELWLPLGSIAWEMKILVQNVESEFSLT